MRTAGSLCIGNLAMAASLSDGSRVRRESHARFCERLEVKSLRPTHPTMPVPAKSKTDTARLPPQHSQPVGGSITTRSRGKCSGTSDVRRACA